MRESEKKKQKRQSFGKSYLKLRNFAVFDYLPKPGVEPGRCRHRWILSPEHRLKTLKNGVFSAISTGYIYYYRLLRGIVGQFWALTCKLVPFSDYYESRFRITPGAAFFISIITPSGVRHHARERTKPGTTGTRTREGKQQSIKQRNLHCGRGFPCDADHKQTNGNSP